MVALEHPPEEEPLAPAEQLPYMWEMKSLPWIRRRVQDQFAGRWCSAVWAEPHLGSIDVSDICPGDGVGLGAANLTTGVEFPAVDSAAELLQLGRIREYLDNHTFEVDHQMYEEAFEALQRLSELKAQDIFAFRETWTDLDTELLRGLDEGAGGFVPDGELTTAAFAARLPSIEELKRVINGGAGSLTGLAIVGGADSLTGRGLGQEIDSHAEVVRFNEIVGEKLVPEETGIRTSVHVMCSKVAPLQDTAVLEIDLETDTAWRSYCGRMHSGGEFANVTDRPLMIRPSAHCVISAGHMQSWTRGFLFYWFIGRLFGSVDFYGFSGSGHYNNPQPIWEKWLPFEHLFYQVNQLARH
jgi:hypothetical protein